MPAQARTYWITGLPAAGKTSLAQALSQALSLSGRASYVLDGDDLRRGLCSDLGLSAADRSENIRRAGEVARLMADAGVNVVCAFVSPFAADRQRVRARVSSPRAVHRNLLEYFGGRMRPARPQGPVCQGQSGANHGPDRLGRHLRASQ